MLSITRTYLNVTRARDNIVYPGVRPHFSLFIDHRHRPNMHHFEYRLSLLSSFNGWTMTPVVDVQLRQLTL